MPSLHYRTKIKSSQTALEVMKLLSSKGAQSASLIYEELEPVGIVFALNFDGHTFNYKLPVNWRDVFEVMKRDVKVSRSAKTAQQVAAQVKQALAEESAAWPTELEIA